MESRENGDKKELKSLFISWRDAKHANYHLARKLLKPFVVGLAVAGFYGGLSVFQEAQARREYSASPQLAELERVFISEGPEAASLYDEQNHSRYQAVLNDYFQKLKSADRNRIIAMGIGSFTLAFTLAGIVPELIDEKKKKIKLENSLSISEINYDTLDGLGTNLEGTELSSS